MILHGKPMKGMIVKMSLKDNFNQAVKEILKKDGFLGGGSSNDETPSKEEKKKSELDKYLEPAPRIEKPATPIADALLAQTDEVSSASPYVATPQNAQSFGRPVTPDPEPVSYNDIVPKSAQQNYNSQQTYSQPSYSQRMSDSFEQQSSSTSQNSQGAFSQNGSNNNNSASMNQGYGSSSANMGNSGNFGGGNNVPPPPSKQQSFASNRKDTPYFETEETTVISRNTVIDGNIRSFANISIDGSVKGDVKITKNINVTGKVVGDIECNNSVMNGASMQGNILSKGQVQVDRDSLLLGDIAAQYLDLNGKIKGNIDVGGKAEFKTDAVILGNITASTITVLDGATIQGYVNTTFLQDTSSSIFPETISVNE